MPSAAGKAFLASGEALIEGMKNSEDYKEKIRQNLDKYLTKERDRALFDLDKKPSTAKQKN
ncbi:hypothetical protein [Vibrio cholerae]|uniref:hypothetical protein n=1 Tax=Vibrio cholerae TaxID=666 RepID=UPI003459D8E0